MIDHVYLVTYEWFESGADKWHSDELVLAAREDWVDFMCKMPNYRNVKVFRSDVDWNREDWAESRANA